MTSEPNPEVVELLEHLLFDAQAGLIQGIAIVSVTSEFDEDRDEVVPDGKSVATAWKGTAGADLWRLAGGVSYLHFRIMQSIERPKEES